MSLCEDSTWRPPHPFVAPQVIKYDADGHLLWANIYWDLTENFQISDVCRTGGGPLWIIGVENGKLPRFTQSLIGIGSDGRLSAQPTFYGTDQGDNFGCAVTGGRRSLVYTAGQAHFADPNATSPLLGGTEATTLTYGPFGDLLRVRRYAGSPLLHSKGRMQIRTDAEDNILVAGQTFDGRINSLFVIKYPP